MGRPQAQSICFRAARTRGRDAEVARLLDQPIGSFRREHRLGEGFGALTCCGVVARGLSRIVQSCRQARMGGPPLLLRKHLGHRFGKERVADRHLAVHRSEAGRDDLRRARSEQPRCGGPAEQRECGDRVVSGRS